MQVLFLHQVNALVRLANLYSSTIKLDPIKSRLLRILELQTTGVSLQEPVCAQQLVKTEIVYFNPIVKLLQRFLENPYEQAFTHTKCNVSRRLLPAADWSEKETDASSCCKLAIAHHFTLALREPIAQLGAYNDALKISWSGIVTQTPITHALEPHYDLGHEKLAFVSDRLSKARMCWSTIEKEACSAMESLERVHWLLVYLQGSYIYMDHSNIFYIFHPTSVAIDISQTAIRKVLRSAVLLWCTATLACISLAQKTFWQIYWVVGEILYQPSAASSTSWCSRRLHKMKFCGRQLMDILKQNQTNWRTGINRPVSRTTITLGKGTPKAPISLLKTS